MIGISYFAIAQIGAAVERPPHLKAIFPFEVTSDLYEAASIDGAGAFGRFRRITLPMLSPATFIRPVRRVLA